jgi:hypothetical protein
LIQLANHAGYDLQFENAKKEDLLNADIMAFCGDTTKLESIYEGIIVQNK